MNTKTPIRKSKVPVSRSAAKPAPAAGPTKKSSMAPAPLKTGQSASANRSKVGPRKAVPRAVSSAPTVPVVPAGQSKQARLISLLQAASGATIEQMTKLTGWQPHTVRGTISGVLRKKLGMNVASESVDDTGTRRYRIIGPVTA
jgi:hypothetical protein